MQTLSQHVHENHPPTVSDLTRATSIPELACPSQHPHLPTRADDHPPPVSGTDISSVHSRQGVPAGPIPRESSSRKRRQALQRIFDRPGKKPAVICEQDLLRLQERSRQSGGRDFAIAWIAMAFTEGVTARALTRALSEEETTAVDHDYGFPLSQAYDGFLEKVENRFACGLCPEAEDKRTNWKHKRYAIRHLQKFHFGIGETCGTWSVCLTSSAVEVY
jgi:hypothetical protein